MNTVELRQRRAGLWEQANALNVQAEAENRALSAEEQQQWDGLMAEMDALKVRIDRMEQLAVVEAELSRSQRAVPVEGGGQQQAAVRGGAEYRRALDLRLLHGPELPSEVRHVLERGFDEQRAYRNAFWRYMTEGMEGLGPEERALVRTGFSAMPAEARALSIGSATAGGYLIADEDMARVVDAMKYWGGMRQSGATIMNTATAAELPIPTSDDTSNTGARLGENAAVSEQDMTVGQKVLRGYTYTSRMIRVSVQLLADAPSYFEGWLVGKLGERVGRITNTEFTTGTGNVMPEGIVTAATLGKTTASASAITWAELLDTEHSVDVAYRQGARWMMNDSTLKYLKQQADGLGRPLWLPGIAVGEPDTILGYPFVVNNDMAAITNSARVILFGQMRNYIIRDIGGMTVLRLTERYADYLQVAFLGFSRHDGALVDAGQHPVKYMQMHS